MKMEFKICVTLHFDGNAVHKPEETQAKIEASLYRGLDIIQACSIGLLPCNATIHNIISEGEINFLKSKQRK